MNAHSYWKQTQGEIPDDKTSSLQIWDVIKQSMSDYLILFLSINQEKDKMDAKPNLLTFVLGCKSMLNG